QIATRPYEKIKILELPDKQFLVSKTLPRLRQKFPGADLLFLMATDSEFAHMPSWPNVEQLLKSTGLIVATHDKNPTFSLPAQPKEMYLLKSKLPNVSSSQIRKAVQNGKTAKGSLKAIDTYIKDKWLYSSVLSSGTPSSTL
ncbi:MAG TPA: hypothetical protein VJJ78_01790, partial [Candidatus Saccharimonadales bacterium]|nr:hypothetical protein [Candidatus Saccharimonadales bacterium]